MAFPSNVIRGDPGDQFDQTTTRNAGIALGTMMIFPDGRKFRYAQAGELLVVGETLQSPALLGNQDMVTATGTSGDTFISVTTDGTEAANFYQDGYIWINSGTNLGRIYQISSHLLLTAGAGDIINIRDENITTTAADDTASLVVNQHKNVITMPATTETGMCVGVACEDIASGSYGWVQTGGMCGVTVDSAIIEGGNIVGTSASAGRADIAGADLEPPIGICAIGPNAGADAGAVFLNLD